MLVELLHPVVIPGILLNKASTAAAELVNESALIAGAGLPEDFRDPILAVTIS
jgi:hypothetical protein